MLRHDILEELIQQLSNVMRKAMGARSKNQHGDALDIVQQGYGQLFGLDIGLISALDVQTLKSLLRSPEEVVMVARLRGFESEQHRILGDTMAHRVGEQAISLFAAAALNGALEGSGLAEAESLCAWIGDQHLEVNARRALRQTLSK